MSWQLPTEDIAPTLYPAYRTLIEELGKPGVEAVDLDWIKHHPSHACKPRTVETLIESLNHYGVVWGKRRIQLTTIGRAWLASNKITQEA